MHSIAKHRKGRKMKNRQLLTICAALIIAAVAFAGLAPVQAQRGEAAAKPLITVLNPAIESKMVDRIPLSPRLDTLEGKTIYLVDINWGGPDAAYSVFEEIQSWFAKNIPSAKIVLKRKYGSYSQDDPKLWKEIAASGNAALIGISG
ncbi:MAG: Thiol-disulfide oxidoreductase protein [Acidobacteria bacterium]|nr:Thiol-disulfide oxidoreductase protein [Acidobacteriota bacterium]